LRYTKEGLYDKINPYYLTGGGRTFQVSDKVYNGTALYGISGAQQGNIQKSHGGDDGDFSGTEKED